MLAVGDSTELEIIFHTKQYKNKISKRPAIETNEGKPDKHIQIISFVTERPDSTYPIIIDPYKLDLSQFSDKVIDEKNFKITNFSDQTLEVALIDQPAGLFDLKLPSSIKPGKSAEAKLELKKEAYGESFEKSVTIEVTGDPEENKTRFTIPVRRTLKVATATGQPKGVSKDEQKP